MLKQLKTHNNIKYTYWLSILFTGLLVFFAILGVLQSKQASATTSSTLNFQARILQASGALVPDGNYHVEFKIFDASSSAGSSQGSCAGDSNCLWTETRSTGNLVRVVNGYLTVNLGSVTAFPAMNWDQEMWLTMNIGGTSGPSWDGEMTPRLKLTAVPYAFKAGQLVATSGANRSTLSFATPTGTRTLTLPDESGTVCTTGSVCTGYAPSTGGSGYIQNTTTVQTNANFAIQSAASGSIGGLIRGATSQTADLLQFQDSSGVILTAIQADGKLAFGPTGAQDTNLYRSAANTLKTDDSFVLGASSATALTVQNSTGSSKLVVVDTTGDSLNLVTNPSIELNATGWSAKGTGTPTRVTTQKYSGDGSLQVTSGASADGGTSYAYTFSTTTTYTLSMYLKGSTNFSTINIGYQEDGSTDTDCLTARSIVTTGWTKFTCTFTTGGTIASSNFYIKDTADSQTFFVDGVQLSQATTVGGYKEGNIQLNGAITSPTVFQNSVNSTTALQVIDSSNTSVLTVDTLNNGVDVGGHLAVGNNATASSILGINLDENNIDADNFIGVKNYLDFEPTTDGYSFYGNDTQLTINSGSSNNIASVLGERTRINHQGTGTVTTATGSSIGVTSTTNDITTANGQIISVDPFSTNSYGQIINVNAYGDSVGFAQTLAQGQDINIDLDNATTVTNAYGTTTDIDAGGAYVSYATGNSINLTSGGAGDIVNALGQDIHIQPYSNSSIGQNILIDAYGDSVGAIQTLVAGQIIDIQAVEGSVVTDAYGQKINFGTCGRGCGHSNIVNAYGSYIEAVAAGSEGIDNFYGVYIASTNVDVSSYGLFIEGQIDSALDVTAALGASTNYTLWLSNDYDSTTASGGITFGASADTNLYRSAADTLQTDDKFYVSTQTTPDGLAQVAISTNATTNKGLVVQGVASQTANLAEFQDSTGAVLGAFAYDGSLTANNSATGTTDTTSGTGTNTTTVTITGTSFADGDVIFIDNAGQDYYTRVTAGGGTSSLTVSPAVDFDNAVTVTKYNIQNIGATSTDYSTLSNRFYQGYFLGGVVTGAGSTTLSDGNLSSTVTLNVNNNVNSSTNINTGTSTGTITLGGGLSPFALNSTNFDVSSAGALSGITTIATSGTINSQTISSTANFTGTLAVQGANSLSLGTASTNTGSALFRSASGSGSIALTPANPGSSTYTITLPAETGTVCTTGSVCTGYSPSTGGTGYIQNGTSVQTNANFAIQSAASGSIGGLIRGATSQTADLLQFQDSSGVILAAIQADGKLAFGPSGSQDTNLYRSAVNTLSTDDTFIVGVAGGGKNEIQITSTTANTGITIGGDTNIYRSAADTLKTDDSFVVGVAGGNKNEIQITSTTANTGITIGGDTNIYRSTANTLMTDDNLVVGSGITYGTTTNVDCAVSCTLTQGNIDSYSAIIIEATAASVVVTVPDPTVTTAGKVVYITAENNTNDFTLRMNAGGTLVDISMRENSTATLIWNGSDWTAAGASSSTDLQAAYNNTLTSAGGAELVLNASGGAADGLTVRNNATTPISGALLEVQTSIGSNLLSINNNATEYAANGGAESSTFTAWTATPAGGTVTRYTTVGDYVATGTASTSVVTGAVANHGVENTLSATLTNNLKYVVSFAVRGTTNFSTLDVLYSQDGSATTSCATAKTVTTGRWTRVTCSFTAPSSGITASNSIFIRQSDGTARTFYVDNLSVTVGADVNHAADGSVDSALGTNWTAFGTLDSLTRDTTTIYDTSGAVNVNTPNNADRGVRNNLSITPSVSTQYLVTFYAKSSNAFSDIRVRYSRDGGTDFESCVDYNTQTVSTSTWTEITCIFTTDSTTPTNADLIIDQTTGSDRIFYIDALSVTLNTNTANNVQVGGANKGGPTTLFTLDRGSSAPVADNNDAYLGSMYYDTTTGRIQCYEADGWGACGAAPDNIVNLNPEYAGAVLNGTGVGTMTTDFCSDDTALTVNTSLCETGEAKNYYKWTSPQATSQTYSIYVTYQLPASFRGFASDDTVQLVGRVDSTTNAEVTYEMYKSTGSAVTQCGSGETDIIAGGGDTANAWHEYGISGNESTGCSFSSSSAGNFIIFKINMKANSNANAYVSTLSFTTNGQ